MGSGWKDLELGAMLREAGPVPAGPRSRRARAGGLAEAAGRRAGSSPRAPPRRRCPRSPTSSSFLSAPASPPPWCTMRRVRRPLHRGDRPGARRGAVHRAEDATGGSGLRLRDRSPLRRAGRCGRGPAGAHPRRPAAAAWWSMAPATATHRPRPSCSARWTRSAKALATIISSVGTRPVVIGGGLAEGWFIGGALAVALSIAAGLVRRPLPRCCRPRSACGPAARARDCWA